MNQNSPQSEEQLSDRSIYASPSGFLVTDPVGIITRVEPEAAFLLHTSLHRMPGRSLTKFIHAPHHGNFHFLINLLTEPELSYEWEASLRLRNGKIIPASFLITTQLNSTQQLELGWLIRDISEQARVRQAREQLYVELERQYQVRTNELIQMNQKLAFEGVSNAYRCTYEFIAKNPSATQINFTFEM